MVCSELFACVVFRLKRFVVKAVFAHVVVHRQTRTDTDTSACLFIFLSFRVFFENFSFRDFLFHNFFVVICFRACF